MTDAGSSAVLAGVSALALESLGVDAFVIAVATIGAVMLHAHSASTVGRARALLQVCTAGVVGALLAQAIFDHALPDAMHSRAVLMLMAAFFGFAAFRVLAAVADRLPAAIDRLFSRLFGGDK
jgi:uncharacterized membrane protein YeaQ/YmgE (transglycosylase-associated protein family)